MNEIIFVFVESCVVYNRCIIDFHMRKRYIAMDLMSVFKYLIVIKNGLEDNEEIIE